MTGAARSFAAELEREKTSQRTHEHLLTKARRGFVMGGRVCGYENVEVKNGDRRVHVEYKINEEQAAIVHELFSRYAEGQGLSTIAKDVKARKIAPPRAGKRGTGSWSTSVLWRCCDARGCICPSWVSLPGSRNQGNSTTRRAKKRNSNSSGKHG